MRIRDKPLLLLRRPTSPSNRTAMCVSDVRMSAVVGAHLVVTSFLDS